MTYSWIGGVRFGKPQTHFEPGKGEIITTSLKKKKRKKNPPRDNKKAPIREMTTLDPSTTMGPDYGVRGRIVRVELPRDFSIWVPLWRHPA